MHLAQQFVYTWGLEKEPHTSEQTSYMIPVESIDYCGLYSLVILNPATTPTEPLISPISTFSFRFSITFAPTQSCISFQDQLFVLCLQHVHKLSVPYYCVLQIYGR